MDSAHGNRRATGVSRRRRQRKITTSTTRHPKPAPPPLNPDHPDLRQIVRCYFHAQLEAAEPGRPWPPKMPHSLGQDCPECAIEAWDVIANRAKRWIDAVRLEVGVVDHWLSRSASPREAEAAVVSIDRLRKLTAAFTQDCGPGDDEAISGTLGWIAEAIAGRSVERYVPPQRAEPARLPLPPLSQEERQRFELFTLIDRLPPSDLAFALDFARQHARPPLTEKIAVLTEGA